MNRSNGKERSNDKNKSKKTSSKQKNTKNESNSDEDTFENTYIEKQAVNDFFKKQRRHIQNKYCYDCRKPSPIWVSLTYSLFLCSDCAARHRSYGVDISFCKSSINDKWAVKDLRRVFVGSNYGASNAGFKPSNYSLGDGKYYQRKLDELVEHSRTEYPEDSFMHVEIKIPTKVDVKVVEEVEERCVNKIGSIYVEDLNIKEKDIKSKEIHTESKKEQNIKTKITEKEKKIVIKEPAFKIQTNEHLSLEADDDNDFYTTDESFDKYKLGIIESENINDNENQTAEQTNKSRYSYRNIGSLQPREYKEKKSIGKKAKNMVVNLSDKGKSVISNLINKFKK